MCGIFGFVGQTNDVEFKKALDQIENRGPDSFGVSHINNVWLGHRRLAILDLTPSGYQPMQSHSGRYSITYNGEIYNFLDLKNELSKFNVSFKGTSDTEVLLEMVEHFGIEQALKKMNGMFSFALYDHKENKLYIARDRSGEKPMYYGIIGNEFCFASQLSPIISMRRNNLSIRRQSIQDYLNVGCIPQPYSIFNEIKKLPQGHYGVVNLTGSMTISVHSYWSLDQVQIDNGLNDESAVLDRLETTLSAAVKRQMISDVPLGAFLSGGVDSSIIAALAQKVSDKKVKTFSVVFDNKDYDESKYARKYADFLGTDHHELKMSAEDLLSYTSKVPQFYDEPFADSSQLPTMALSALAKKYVTVALTGDAGDELFAGYNRHLFAKKYLGLLTKLGPIADLNIRALEVLGSDALLHLSRMLGVNVAQVPEKLYKLQKLVGVRSLADYYAKTVSMWTGSQSHRQGDGHFSHHSHLDAVSDLTRLDFKNYMADDVLVKVDRGAMSASLETRAPFLDQHVIELAFAIPSELKIKGNSSKYILKELRKKLYPGMEFNSAKMGFAVPLAEWFRAELKNDVLEIINNSQSKIYDYLDKTEVQKIHDEFYKQGQKYHASSLWIIYQLEQWFRYYKF